MANNLHNTMDYARPCIYWFPVDVGRLECIGMFHMWANAYDDTIKSVVTLALVERYDMSTMRPVGIFDLVHPMKLHLVNREDWHVPNPEMQANWNVKKMKP